MLSRPLLLRVQAHIAFLPLSIQDGSSLPVKQFQYTGWPEEGVPDTGSGLIDLIGQVQKWQRNSGDKPIVVHCRLVYTSCNKHSRSMIVCDSLSYFPD